MSTSSPSCIVYSCSFRDYDPTFGPLVGTPGVKFLRFGTTRPNRWRIWEHLPVPKDKELATQSLTNRRFKMFPHEVLPPCDIAIYVDGNILIRADLTPLIEEFWASGADMALFPHPSGRTVDEEFDAALRVRIPPKDAPIAETQRQRYRDLGFSEVPITENSILFYRMSSPKIAEFGKLWWEELQTYTKRDQVSVPFVIDQVQPKIHYWPWHFAAVSEENVYFARYPHNGKNRMTALRRTGFFMKDYTIDYWLLHQVLVGVGKIRRLVMSPFEQTANADDKRR